MSDTKRKAIQGGHSIDNGAVIKGSERMVNHEKRPDCIRPKKLTPYMRADVPYKGRFKRGEHFTMNQSDQQHHAKMGNTSTNTKIENDNANRSLKKSVRQQLKKELSKELNQIQK